MIGLRPIVQCTCAIAFTGFLSSASAQDARLVRRLDRATASAVAAYVDSAKLAGLPTEPLIQKALEGESKEAPPHEILAAVRALGASYQEARSALGNATQDELATAVGALAAGAQPGDLRRLRQARPGNLTEAFIGLTFLLQRGVAATNATGIVVSMLEAKLSGSDFTTLQRLVEQDIRAGAPPAEAARVRSRALILHGRRPRSQEEGGP
jgi:hypothetical protein